MLARLLLVTLLILNAGTALWWWSRPPAVPATVVRPVSAPGVPELELVDEAALPPAGMMPALMAGPEADELPQDGPGDTPAPAVGEGAGAGPASAATADADMASAAAPPASAALPATTPPATSPAPAPAPVCARLGPFADAAGMTAARKRLAGLWQSHREQWAQETSTQVWRVMLPPLESAAEATQMARKLAAAGFNDYFIIRQGEQANAVALGQFRQQQGALRHRDALVAAGFPAVMSPGATTAARGHLVVRLNEGVSLQRLRSRAGAGVGVDSIDCRHLR